MLLVCHVWNIRFTHTHIGIYIFYFTHKHLLYGFQELVYFYPHVIFFVTKSDAASSSRNVSTHTPSVQSFRCPSCHNASKLSSGNSKPTFSNISRISSLSRVYIRD